MFWLRTARDMWDGLDGLLSCPPVSNATNPKSAWIFQSPSTSHRQTATKSRRKLPQNTNKRNRRCLHTQTLNARERQDLEGAIPHFQNLWSTFDPCGTGKIPAKHLHQVRKQFSESSTLKISQRGFSSRPSSFAR